MTATPRPRNLEIKVQCQPDDLDDLLQRLRRHTCASIDQVHQVDTYFAVPRGRLKVREFRSSANPGMAERGQLIGYARNDEAGSRWSRYEVVPVSGEAIPPLLEALALTHDELARVDKMRRVGLIGHTRVHLDEVKGLGAFCELETVMDGIDDAQGVAEHEQVIAALGMGSLPVVPGSYSDLVVQRAAAEG